MSELIPLFVDLDGTIIEEDIGNLAFKHKIKSNIFSLITIFFKFIISGKSAAKLYVSKEYKVNANKLKFNKQCLEYVKQEKRKGRKVFLLSGSHIILVEQFLSKLKIFDGAYGTHKDYNMISQNKVNYIYEKLNIKSFDYIGNSHQDIAVWKNSKNIIYTNVNNTVKKKIKLLAKKNIYLNENFVDFKYI